MTSLGFAPSNKPKRGMFRVGHGCELFDFKMNFFSRGGIFINGLGDDPSQMFKQGNTVFFARVNNPFSKGNIIDRVFEFVGFQADIAIEINEYIKRNLLGFASFRVRTSNKCGHPQLLDFNFSL